MVCKKNRGPENQLRGRSEWATIAVHTIPNAWPSKSQHTVQHPSHPPPRLALLSTELDVTVQTAVTILSRPTPSSFFSFSF